MTPRKLVERGRVYEMPVTDPIPWRIIDGYVDIDAFPSPPKLADTCSCSPEKARICADHPEIRPSYCRLNTEMDQLEIGDVVSIEGWPDLWRVVDDGCTGDIRHCRLQRIDEPFPPKTPPQAPTR